MATIGQYQTVQELSRADAGGVAKRVYTARQVGIDEPEIRYDQLETPEHFVVKAYFLETSLKDSPNLLSPFIEQASTQRRLNNAGARHWAMLHDTGKYHSGIFVVTPYYARTAQQVVARAGDISEDDLHAIVSGVLAGLLELKRVLRRPHGNLKPSNILITSHSPLKPMDVVLCDLAPMTQAVSEMEWADLRAMGELIYRLVLHQPLPGQMVHPIPASAEWANLGRHADTWHALCGRLLGAAPGEGRLKLASIVAMMRVLRPPVSPGRRRRMALAAAALLAAAATGVLGYRRYTQEWSNLCIALNGWAGPIDHAAALDPPGLTQTFSQDDYLRRKVLPLIEKIEREGPYDPRHLAGGSELSPAALGNHPPESFSTAWHVHQAYNTISELYDNLSRWPGQADIAQRAREYDSSGRPQLAAYASALAGRLEIQSGNDLPASFKEWPQAHQALEEIDESRSAAASQLVDLQSIKERSSQRPRLEEISGPVEVVLRGAATADATSANLGEVKLLATRMTEAKAVGDKLVSALPLLDVLSASQQNYEARGWRGPAQYLGRLIDQWSPYDERQQTQSDLSETAQLIDAIDQRWTRIGERGRTLEASKDRLLQTYGAFITRSLGNSVDAPDLSQLLQRLDAINSDEAWGAAAVVVGSAAWQRIDVALLSNSPSHAAFHTSPAGHPATSASAVAMAPPGSSGPIIASDEDLRLWLGEVRQPLYRTGIASATVPSPVAGGFNAATHPIETLAIASTNPTNLATTNPIAAGHPAPTTASLTAEAVITPPPIDPTARQFGAAWMIGLLSDLRQAPAALAVRQAAIDAWTADYRTAIERANAVSDFADECNRSTIPAIDGIQQEWARRNREFAQMAQQNPALIESGLRITRFRLKNRLLQIDEAYKALEPLELPDSHAPGRAAWNVPLREELDRQAEAQRVRCLGDVLELTRRDAAVSDEDFFAAIRAMAPRYNDRRDQAARLMADMNETQRLLQEGYALNEAPSAGGTSASALIDRWKNNDLFTNASVQQAIWPLLEPIAEVRQTSDRGELLRMAENDAEALGIRLTAWVKLAHHLDRPWPADRSELEADKDLRPLLAASAGLLAEPRRAHVGDEIARNSRKQWESFLASARQADAVEAALDWHEAFGVADPSGLDPAIQFNWALRDLRQYLSRQDNPSPSDSQLQDLVKNLRQAGELLPPSARQRPQIETLVSGLEGWKPEDPDADFNRLGPLSASAEAALGARIRWNVTVGPDELWVAYRGIARDETAGDQQRPLLLIFRRYELPASTADNAAGPAHHAGGADQAPPPPADPTHEAKSSGAFYLCTTDVTLGCFTDVISAGSRWRDVRTRQLLWDYDPLRDPRPGPRGWEWTSNRPDAAIAKSLIWLSSSWLPDGVDHYPETLGQEFNPSVLSAPTGITAEAVNPSRRQPMQWISVDGAEYMAHLLGARLPSIDEWNAAYNKEGKTALLAQANLRDHTWRLELEHLAAVGRLRPDAGMFVPAGEAASNDIWTSGNGADYNDGVLWFREIAAQVIHATDPAGPPMQDLVGNVCQYVRDAAGKVYAIGASALSPPSRKIDQPFEVDPRQGGRGFADVGVRLAISGPVRPMQRLLASLPPSAWYLTAAGATTSVAEPR